MQHRRQLEHQALEAVLSSQLFLRSKSLPKLLQFICTKYFEGQADEIKEYSIAVEALGRPPDFDPKKDAIVRVEMHRLRKRLRDYYLDEGENAPIQIVLGEKGYVPEFVVSPGCAASSANGLTLEAEPRGQEAAEHSPAGAPARRIRFLPRMPIGLTVGVTFVLALVAVGLLVSWSLKQVTRAGPAATGKVVETQKAIVPAAVTAESEIRILAGRGPGAYTDRDGHVWEGDRYFQGGQASTGRNDVVTRGFDRNIFGGSREGRFEYQIPLRPGSYEMELFFAETMYGEGNPLGGGESYRGFNVLANGVPLVSAFDILADTGVPNSADSRMFKDLHPAPDGLLHLSFEPVGTQKALLNAIWIRPGQPGRINPIRIVARPQAYQDANGNWWQPDRYYAGGAQILRPEGPTGVEDGDLYRGERYGNFTYSIPVPPGHYQATLYMREYWWGKGHVGGPGTRRFDVYCNFKPLLTDFEILSAGGALQAVAKTFHGLTPNAQGRLVLAFVPEVNYALVNAIEILDEGK